MAAGWVRLVRLVGLVGLVLRWLGCLGWLGWLGCWRAGRPARPGSWVAASYGRGGLGRWPVRTSRWPIRPPGGRFGLPGGRFGLPGGRFVVADSGLFGGRFGCLVADSGLFGGRFGPHPRGGISHLGDSLLLQYEPTGVNCIDMAIDASPAGNPVQSGDVGIWGLESTGCFSLCFLLVPCK